MSTPSILFPLLVPLAALVTVAACTVQSTSGPGDLSPGSRATGANAGEADSGGDAPAAPDGGDPSGSASTTDAAPDAPPSALDAGRCVGFVQPCSLQAPPTCGGIAGCAGSSATCSGVSAACFEQTSSFGCSRLQGCYWDSTSSSCSGVSSPCDVLGGETACVTQTGCSWSPGGCSGVATPCASMLPSTCRLQPGCSLR